MSKEAGMAERKKWKKHVGAVLLALLAALSAFSPLSVKAAAETVENGISGGHSSGGNDFEPFQSVYEDWGAEEPDRVLRSGGYH